MTDPERPPHDADRAAELEKLLYASGVVRDLVMTYGAARVARWVRHLVDDVRRDLADH